MANSAKKYTRDERCLMTLAECGQALCRNELADMAGSRTEWVCRSVANLLERDLVRVVGMKKSSVSGVQGQAIGLTTDGHRAAAAIR